MHKSKISFDDYIYLPMEKQVRTRYNFKNSTFEQMSLPYIYQCSNDWKPVEPTTYMHNFIVGYLIDHINKHFGV